MLWDSIQKKEKMCVCSFFFVILHHEFENIMKLGHFSTIAFLLLLLFTAETVWAERVSETEAFQKAKAFMSGRGMRQQRQQQAPRRGIARVFSSALMPIIMCLTRPMTAASSL